MINELFPHQIKAADFLLNHRRGCLFHEVGVGKTNSAISAVNKLPRGKLLICAPKCVIVGMWQRYDDLPINQNYELVSYEYISRNYKDFASKRYDYIIADECHKLKSTKSNVSKCFRLLSKNAKYVWGLTGTPYATSFLDVYGIFKALAINEFSETYDSFMHAMYECEAIYVAAGRFIYRPVRLRPGMLDILINRISKHASVLRTEDCVKLPGLTVNEIEVEGMNTKEYKDGLKGIITYADGAQETVNKLACIQKLHQLSNGFVYDADHKATVFKANTKLETCATLVQMGLESRDKLVIVYIYKYDLECLEKMLDDLKISHTTDFSEFSSMQVLLMQEQRAIGVNLQSFTNYMILYTYNYAYLEYNQTVGRIYRVGQKQPCSVYVLINKGTSERKIWNAVQKAYNMDTVFKDLMFRLEEGDA